MDKVKVGDNRISTNGKSQNFAIANYMIMIQVWFLKKIILCQNNNFDGRNNEEMIISATKM